MFNYCRQSMRQNKKTFNYQHFLIRVILNKFQAEKMEQNLNKINRSKILKIKKKRRNKEVETKNNKTTMKKKKKGNNDHSSSDEEL